ncbi:hypothetical protein TREMEDRAFT_67030 [Tremella mesenterica DSM 1558]|uniref:uncharacterized protein n=1 Tax=Tremella mesenterica (strain ATCC 24925 / CBS 8224 / DSM 1558 / NBRC 9311 / NRRL Y-6157 / RJB 2259-6 / UBC 559-6) TaxID=578456 RepID=UPI0003F48F2E|nr:uncharacterized protein TREMEDRAFT_67030 [Tremella mesenterica DSM 1558]EIW72733.1 hypothetical protein TREMEDRAFT_67030 [Tremella mesenterica DSM 1558]
MSSEPLLGTPGTSSSPSPTLAKRKAILTTVVVPILLLAGIIFVAIKGEGIPKDDLGKARYYLKSSPVLDGHVDLPIAMREIYGNNLSAFDLDGPLPGHYDTSRARKGHLGGFFWAIFTECREEEEGKDFMIPSVTVRDTLEQIDLSVNLIEKHSSDYALCRTADDVMAAIRAGKIASLLGMEGAHMLGNSLGVLRTYYDLGVRYLTLTHSCNNAFADSAGIFGDVEERWGGLSPLGRELVKEMNRLGIIVDLSHVSDKTALQALSITRAPVMWSHSCARHFNDMQRNIPDEVLDKVGKGKGKVDGVVMVNFYNNFALPKDQAPFANVSTIADHIEYIADRIGRHHVGIGSDYDGVEVTPAGLEDVSKYPNLFAELIKRGWNQRDLSLLAGGNLLRIMRGVEDVSKKLRKHESPNMAKYDKRHDLDGHKIDF